MAKATIVFEDNGDGTVDITTEFDPPAKGSDPPTPAQYTAMLALKSLSGSDGALSEISSEED